MATFKLNAASTSNRWLDIEAPSPKGSLVIESVSGSETLGRLFEYEVLALSNTPDLSFDDILGKHVTVLMEVDDGGLLPRRAIDGRVAQIAMLGAVRNFDNLYRYRLILRPWLWMLTRTQDCRIFQKKTTEAILKEVFEDHTDVDFDFKLTGQYATREYCVQYRESDFDFISRLMEEDGIYYFFKHEPGKHTLTICDGPSNHESVGLVRMHNDDDRPGMTDPRIHQWTVRGEIQPGGFAMRDYNFETPSLPLDAVCTIEQAHSEAKHEVFDYPGLYDEVRDGEDGEKPEGVGIARKRLEEIQAGYQIVEGRGDSRLLVCGALFTLTHHLRFDQNKEHLVVSSHLEAENNLPEMDVPASFDCRFRLLRADMQYRSPRTTRRPAVQGPQTAVVVGPDGEEIHVDEFGRVKVQFHWDRRGKHNDESSCWVRVSQIWAGKNYGWMTVPRIGQEVVVDFLEGNPDRPLITGRVYNAEQMPPWALPANKTQSGILTRSSKGGTPDNANELKFEDEKGKELITIHAERNMSRSVEVDDSINIGRDQMHVVKRDQSNVIQRDQSTIVQRDQSLAVTNNRAIHVKNNETHIVDVDQAIKIGGNQELKITGNQAIKIDGKHSMGVAGDIETSTDANRKDKTAGNESRSVTGNQSVAVTGNVEYKAANITFEAGHIAMNVTGGSSYVVSAPIGPYSIMTNKFNLLSNTDASILAVGNINQTSMGNNTTVMGSNSSGYMGSASDTNMGLARNTFMGLALETFIGASISNTLAVQVDNVAAARLTAAVGVAMEMDSMKMYLPAGSAAAAGQTVAGPVATAVSIGAALGFAGWGIGALLLGAKELGDQYREARKELKEAAQAAADAGHPGLAARLNRLSETGSAGGGDGDSGPQDSDHITATDKMHAQDTKYGVTPTAGSDGSKESAADYERRNKLDGPHTNRSDDNKS
ncbi:type VI secretion system tip protein TssI/VgrG [Panacagrimonas sp.]|uniref:type VI secretion system Vgr family protein n=1 Tax=Panacagrimonas sp. TaxID=2480088 RepID=UPI003B52AB80